MINQRPVTDPATPVSELNSVPENTFRNARLSVPEPDWHASSGEGRVAWTMGYWGYRDLGCNSLLRMSVPWVGAVPDQPPFWCHYPCSGTGRLFPISHACARVAVLLPARSDHPGFQNAPRLGDRAQGRVCAAAAALRSSNGQGRPDVSRMVAMSENFNNEVTEVCQLPGQSWWFPGV